MDNPAIYLWIPIIIISVLSILKLITQQISNGKPWIRIEKEEDNA